MKQKVRAILVNLAAAGHISYWRSVAGTFIYKIGDTTLTVKPSEYEEFIKEYEATNV